MYHRILMVGKDVVGRLRLLTLAAIALYVLVLALSPFEHHDLLCHLKTPQHCGSCSSSTAGVDPQAPAVLDGHQFSDAGRAIATVATGDDVLLVSPSSGRSPPASL
jgi:hypothetical protein